MAKLKSTLAVIFAPKRNNTIYVICFIYIVFISLFMLYHRLWFSPDQFFLAAILAAMFLGGTMQFLKDWVPFVVLFLGYEYLRGLAPILNKNVHIYEMINIDKFIFGFIPSLKLQELLFHPNQPAWYDFISIFLYTLHFIVPMITAFVFWMLNKKIFREFTIALIVLSFAGFTTYVLFPAMPPWMASERGFIPHLDKIMDTTIANLGQPLALPTIYKFFRGNDVAAMPSLHAAYPLLVLLFFVRAFKKRGLLLIPYVLGVWFAVVYLGEHYAIDVIVGAIYAVVVFTLVVKWNLISTKAKLWWVFLSSKKLLAQIK